MNAPPPGQFVPVLPAGAQLQSVAVVPYPEGANFYLDDTDDKTVVRDAFRRATELLRGPLPAALPQDCCMHSQVKLSYGGGLVAVYEPCNLPQSIEDVAQLAVEAFRP
jgi:hypothetical protein